MGYALVRTARLELRAYRPADLADLHELHADAAVWTHFPSGRHSSRQLTQRMLTAAIDQWLDTGLGLWTARLIETGEFVGVGGCGRYPPGWWNIYYRFRPAAQGNGYAGELVAAALPAAAAVDPDVPVVAKMLEHNRGSVRVAERAGLALVWRGADQRNPDPSAVRLVYADRPVSPEVLAAALGR